MAPAAPDTTPALAKAPPPPSDNKPWLVLAVLSAASALALAAGLECMLYRRRQYRQVADAASDPPPKRASPSVSDDETDDLELQQCHAIRKALASRSASCLMMPSDAEADDADSRSSSADLVRPQRSLSLLTGWKQWEARIHQDTSRSLTRHPGIGGCPRPSSSLEAPVPPLAYAPARRPLTYPAGMAEGAGQPFRPHFELLPGQEASRIGVRGETRPM